MTTCPELDALMALTEDRASFDVATHVRSCPRCQRDLSWLRLVPDAITGKDLDVPDELQWKTLEALGSLPVGDDERVGVGGRALVGALAAVTVALALWVTGSAGSAGTSALLTVSCGIGCAYAVMDAILARRGEIRMARQRSRA